MATTLPRISAAKVLATLDREWDGLAAHRGFPDLPLDNNTAERAIRTGVVGRKNYNGSGARWPADLAGHAWTILATARMAGHNPRAYLAAYLDACARNGGKPPAGHALQALLPWTITLPGVIYCGRAVTPAELGVIAASPAACPPAGLSPTPSATPWAGGGPTAAAKT